MWNIYTLINFPFGTRAAEEGEGGLFMELFNIKIYNEPIQNILKKDPKIVNKQFGKGKGKKVAAATVYCKMKSLTFQVRQKRWFCVS